MTAKRPGPKRPRLTTAPSSLSAPSSGAGGAAPLVQRGTARQRGYDSRWDRASLGFLRAHSLCLGCQAVGLVRASAVTDHIEPHKGSRRLFWARDNWQPCGRWHHDAVKQQLERRFEAGELAADDLRLDSAAAVALTRRLLAQGQGPCAL